MAIGCGEVRYEPRYYNNPGKQEMCTFSLRVENYRSKQTNDDGKAMFESITYSAVAFRGLANYCKNLEKRDTVFFVGRRTYDEYATKKANDGETRYKIILEICMVQPTVQTPAEESDAWVDYDSEDELEF